MSTLPWSRALVIGASSGIGEALVRELATGGVRVAAVARREGRLQSLSGSLRGDLEKSPVETYRHDVRDLESIPSLFQRIALELGGLDLVVYAAGIQPQGGSEEYRTAEDADTVAVNLIGAMGWLNEAATRFTLAGEGTIVGISSVAGDRGRFAGPAYNASKGGLNIYLQALGVRLRRHGVVVLTVKPGYVLTPLLEGVRRPPVPPAISAERAATEILSAAARGRRVAYIPSWWRPIMAIIRVRAPLFERLKI